MVDSSRKTRLIKTKLTPMLEEYVKSLEGVSNYVRGTFSLFDVARSRRLKTLFAPRIKRDILGLCLP